MPGNDDFSVPSEQVRNDLDAVCEAHGLSRGARRKLARIVTGAVPGNRDRPLHGLSETIAAWFEIGDASRARQGLFDLIVPGSHAAQPMSGTAIALLDFLASMDDARYFDDIERAVAMLEAAPNPRTAVPQARSIFASALHSYRTAHLPHERYRQRFSEIRKFLAVKGLSTRAPEDGDALEFWIAEGTRQNWTEYETVLSAFNNFVEAANDVHPARVVSLNALSENGFDVADGTHVTPGHAEDLPVPEDLVSALHKLPLKLYLDRQLRALERLSAHFTAGLRWPRSCLAFFCFSPAQRSLTTLARKGAPARQVSDVASCSRCSRYEDQLELLGEMISVAEDAMTLLHILRREGTGNVSASSKAQAEAEAEAEAEKRAKGMLRRKSFAGLRDEQLVAELESIAPVLEETASRLRTVQRRWTAWLEAGGIRRYAPDRSLFSKKLKELYCEQQTGGSTSAGK